MDTYKPRHKEAKAYYAACRHFPCTFAISLTTVD